MVKSLTGELSDILDWIENPGLEATSGEQARTALVIFCRGLVCGLRAADAQPFAADEGIAKELESKWDRNKSEGLADACDRPAMGTPLKERLKY